MKPGTRRNCVEIGRPYALRRPRRKGSCWPPRARFHGLFTTQLGVFDLHVSFGLVDRVAPAHVLLSVADKTIGLCDRLVGCFRDHRNADLVTHESVDLLRQRIFALGLGYKDLIDHDVLRFDLALMAVLDRREDALAGKSTPNRLEHASKIGHDRNHNLYHHPSAIERLFVDVFMDAHEEPPIRIVLALDATDDRLFGLQKGRHFHGYYDCYCYLPLYIFCGRHLLAANLRSSSVDGAHGAKDEVGLIVAQKRTRASS